MSTESAPTSPESLCRRFEADWTSALAGGPRPRLEDVLQQAPESARPDLLSQLLILEQGFRARLGETLSPNELLARLLQLSAALSADQPTAQGGPVIASVRSTNADDTPHFGDLGTHPQIPGYELLGVLGRGGMGVVYQARQLRPSRVVALKMILSGSHASSADLARFGGEAEAIAALRHPNVVQLFESGECQGRPYFTLEFVEGGSLAHKIKQATLAAQEAARLVEQLARGVHFAHTKGIVHRDLKPANVLLCDDGTPKVTDFGLAKRVEAGPGLTDTGSVLGTPSYMAPEQARGDIRRLGPLADVYSLGAILYECLTGRPPFLAANTTETLLQVLNTEPASVRQLQPSVPVDLETICHKCLQKEPHRRYGSALELAEDCAAFLAGRPISARPVGFLERGWRLCRRHPGIASSCAAAVFFLVAGLIGMGILYLQAEEQREHADHARDQADAARQLAESETGRANTERDLARNLATEADLQRQQADTQRNMAREQAERSRQVSRVLTGMFDASDPLGLNGIAFGFSHRAGQKLMARELLERALQTTNQDTSLSPAVKADVYQAIGNVYRSLGMYTTSEPLLHKALEIRKSSSAPPAEVASSLHALGWLHHERGDYSRAEDLYQQALRQYEKAAERDEIAVVNTKFNLAWLWTEMYLEEQAEEQLMLVLRERIRLFGEDHRETVLVRGGLASLYLKSGKMVAAAPLIAQVSAAFEKQGIDRNVLNAATLFQQGVLQEQLFGNYNGAIKLLRRSAEVARETIGARHLYVAAPLTQLGLVLEKKGEPAEALKSYTEALEIVREATGIAHPQVGIIVERMAFLYRSNKQPEKAEALFRELLEAREERYGKSHFFVADTLLDWSFHAGAMRNRSQQDALLARAEQTYRQTKGRPPRMFPTCLDRIGMNHYRQKDYVQSERYHREALAVCRQLYKKSHPDVAQCLLNLTSALVRLDDKARECDKLLTEANQMIGGLNEPYLSHYRHLWVQISVELACSRDQDHQKAAGLLDRYRAKGAAHLEEQARSYVACLRALEQDRNVSGENRERLEKRYGAAAVGRLRLVWKAQPGKPQGWLDRPDFAPLRERADFQNLRKEVEQARKK